VDTPESRKVIKTRRIIPAADGADYDTLSEARTKSHDFEFRIDVGISNIFVEFPLNESGIWKDRLE